MGPKPVNVLEFSVMFLPAAVGANLWLVSVLLPVLNWPAAPGMPQRGLLALAGRGTGGSLARGLRATSGVAIESQSTTAASVPLVIATTLRRIC